MLHLLLQQFSTNWSFETRSLQPQNPKSLLLLVVKYWQFLSPSICRFADIQNGSRVFRFGNSWKSRSFVTSSSTPWTRQSAAIRASCTIGPRTRGWLMTCMRVSEKSWVSASNKRLGAFVHADAAHRERWVGFTGNGGVKITVRNYSLILT